MKTIRKPILTLLQVLGLSALLLFLLFLLQTAPAVRAQDKTGGSELPVTGSQPSSNCDAYGYCWTPTTFAWKDLQHPGAGYVITYTRVLTNFYPSRDDGYALVTFPAGFTYKFYEYSNYTQVYINTNGLLTFGSGSTVYFNRPIPQDLLPNNFIAPFWDDLTVYDTGAIYYAQGKDNYGDFFAVEWQNVPRVGGTSEQETFEVLLYKNGDIRFQYLSLTGDTTSATVGVEDKEGTIGTQIYYNQSGLGNDQAYLIQRPSSLVRRAKVLPEYESGLVIMAPLSFPFQVRNTGDLGADTYTFSFTSSRPGWSATVYNTSGSQVLTNTGSLSFDATGSYQLVVTAPANAAPGDTLQSTLVISSTDKTVADRLPFLAAVPAPFAQTWNDGSSIYLSRFCRTSLGSTVVGSLYTGIGVSRTSLRNYFFAHEQSLSQDGKYYTNLVYSILNPFGSYLKSEIPLLDNGPSATVTMTVESHYFSPSPGQNGEMGVAWQQTDTINNHTRYNVYYAVVNSAGVVSLGPVNVTGNILRRGVDDYAPLFSSPQILVSGNRIYLAWVQSMPEDVGDRYELYYAVYNTSGGTVQAPALLSAGAVSTKAFGNPSLVAYDAGALLVYSISGTNNRIASTHINVSGVPSALNATLSNTGGSGVETDHLSNNNILATWVNAQTQQVAVALFNSSANSVLYGPVDLPLAYPRDFRAPSFIAATHDELGRAILTWRVDTSDFLYYALLDGNTVPAGARLITPPMRFISGSSVNNGNTSKSSAPFGGAMNFYLSIIHR